MGNNYNCMRDNKEYLLIEKEVWERMCSKVAVVSQKRRVYEQPHKPEPKIYTNKEAQQLLGIDDKYIRKYQDEGLLGYTKVKGKYLYSLQDIVGFLEKNKHKSFDVKL